MTIPTPEILENFKAGWSVMRLCQHYVLSTEVVEAIIRRHCLAKPAQPYAEYVNYPRKGLKPSG